MDERIFVIQNEDHVLSLLIYRSRRLELLGRRLEGWIRRRRKARSGPRKDD
jgi:hypothetical protein